MSSSDGDDGDGPLHGDITCTRHRGYVNFRFLTPYVEHPEQQEVYELDLTYNEIQELLCNTVRGKIYELRDTYIDHMYFNEETQEEERRPGGKIGADAGPYKLQRLRRFQRQGVV